MPTNYNIDSSKEIGLANWAIGKYEDRTWSLNLGSFQCGGQVCKWYLAFTVIVGLIFIGVGAQGIQKCADSQFLPMYLIIVGVLNVIQPCTFCFMHWLQIFKMFVVVFYGFVLAFTAILVCDAAVYYFALFDVVCSIMFYCFWVLCLCLHCCRTMEISF